MLVFPMLQTERLVLREIKTSDKKEIFTCFSNSQLLRFYGMEQMKAVTDAEQLINAFAFNFKEKKGIRWGIELKETNQLIGTIGFNLWMPKHKRAEVGYEILPQYWGQGYAKEVLREVVSYGFETMQLSRIGAVVFIENDRSNHLLTKFGFQREGVLRNYMVQNDQSFDTYVYSLLKAECREPKTGQ